MIDENNSILLQAKLSARVNAPQRNEDSRNYFTLSLIKSAIVESEMEMEITTMIGWQSKTFSDRMFPTDRPIPISDRSIWTLLYRCFSSQMGSRGDGIDWDASQSIDGDWRIDWWTGGLFAATADPAIGWMINWYLIMNKLIVPLYTLKQIESKLLYATSRIGNRKNRGKLLQNHRPTTFRCNCSWRGYTIPCNKVSSFMENSTLNASQRVCFSPISPLSVICAFY